MNNVTIRNIPLNGKSLNPNMRELTFEYSGAVVFFSYRTPVAAKIPNGVHGGFRYLRTTKGYSVTTTKHINKWLERQCGVEGNLEMVEQSVINALVPSGVTVG